MSKTKRHEHVSLQDVAKRAGVSTSTVSNVLNGRKRFSAKTRVKVEKAISDLGYMPDKAASSLRSARHWTISVVIVDESGGFLRDPAHADIVAGLADELREQGYDLELKLSLRSDFEVNKLFRRRSTDAIVLLASGDSKELSQIMATLSVLELPIVIIKNSDPIEMTDVALVDQDDQESTRAVAEHLVARGARSFWFVSSKIEWYAFEQRYAGLKQALSSLDTKFELKRVRAETEHYEDICRAIREFYEEHEKPDAIIGANDALALSSMKQIQDLGCSVPDDVLVSGFNGMDVAKFARPRLTTVQAPLHEMGRTAGLLAIERLRNGEFPARKSTHPVSLIRGDST